MHAYAARHASSAARYFLVLGSVGFGGPAVLVERTRRDLEEGRGWFTREEYKEGLALAQFAPGPLAAQLAIYLGWVRGGVSGATLVGVAFIVPSFLMVLVLSAAYVRYDGLPWMRGAFYGVGAVVIARRHVTSEVAVLPEEISTNGTVLDATDDPHSIPIYGTR
ncbi:MAG: chromate transporter, partial [bacterium]